MAVYATMALPIAPLRHKSKKTTFREPHGTGIAFLHAPKVSVSHQAIVRRLRSVGQTVTSILSLGRRV